MEYKQILALWLILQVVQLTLGESDEEDTPYDGTGITVPIIPNIKLNSGYGMPMLGLGTARLEQLSLGVVKDALELGYRLIDTGKTYIGSSTMTSEQAIGIAISESGVPREELFIITKLPPANFAMDLCRNGIEESLKYFQTDYIDLVLIHYPACFDDPDCISTGTYIDCWMCMEKLIDDGLVRSIGLSNFLDDEIAKVLEIAKHPVSVLQNWFDPYYQDQGLRAYCQDLGIVYMGYSTLGLGWLEDGMDVNPVLEDEVIKKIGGKYGRPASDVVLRWANERKVVVVPCSKRKERLATNLNSLNFDLSDKDLEKMDQLDGKIEPDFLPEEEGGALARPYQFLASIVWSIRNFLGFNKKEISDEL